MDEIDASVAHSARIWNYWLGGKDWFPVDRRVGDQIAEMFPDIVRLARADRAFLGRAVRYLAGEAGIRQFLDIGTGLPTADNTHQVAQGVAPESRIVYVDNDPLVLVHARALLTGTAEGAIDYIEADLSDPDQIAREASKTLDFDQPVAVMLLGILHHIPDDDVARTIVDRLVDVLAPGSYLTIAHSTNQVTGAAMDEAVRHWNQFGKPSMTLRTTEAITRFFDRLELLEPGVVSTTRWRPDPADAEAGPIRETDEFCGVGRKPA
ncbi:MAG TPA: SAM-dependent methyltransferase [Actinomycetes bacterium]